MRRYGNSPSSEWPLNPFAKFLGGLLFCLLALPVVAEEWSDSFQLHGFISQGYVLTNENRWYGDSTSGSWDLREIGVNASIRPLHNLQLSAQLLSRTAGGMDNGEPGVDYALVDWTLLSDVDKTFGVRLGRIKNALGFYNETRDVAFTRPGIFMPQSIYFDRVRDLMLSSDGIRLYGSHRSDDTEFMLQVGVGKPLVDANVEATFLGREIRGALKGDDPLWLGHLAIEHDGGRWRAALSGVKGSLSFSRGLGDPPQFLDSGEIDFHLLVASLQYNTELWSLTGELLEQEVKWRNLGPFFPERAPGRGYYVQFDLRPLSQFEFFVRYGERIPDTKDPDGSLAEANRGIPAHTQFAKDWVLGVRWDPTDDLMIRAEYHWVDGTAWISNRENSLRETVALWNIASVLVSYRF